MKRYNLHIIAFILGIFLFSGCQDDDLVKKGSDIKEGIPVTLKLSYDGADVSQVQTRTDIGQAENSVRDIYVLVFKQSGNEWIKEAGELHHVEAGSSGTITMAENSVTSGVRRIFAVGNVSSLGSSFGVSTTDLDNVQSLADLNNLVAGIGTVERSSGLLVSGAFVATDAEVSDLTGASEVKEPTGTSTTVNLNGKIKLKRLDAKIKFEVLSHDSVVFIPKSWRVEKFPTSTNLIEQSADVINAYASSEDRSFDNYTKHTTGSNKEDYSGGDFTFYMFENHKTNNAVSITYEDRERQTKVSDGHGNYTNGDFVNADQNATYVVIKGDYKVYKSDGTAKTTANVKYTVHLGDINLRNNNFDTDRNTSYTYKVTVVGVENIVTEVVKQDINTEPQPGAEGDVVRSDQSFLFDSHYETKVITFKKDELSNLSVIVKTPYNNPAGSYDYSTGTGVEDHFVDYEWVSFIKNETTKGHGGSTTAKTDFATYHPKKTMDITQLLKELYENKDNATFWDSKGEAKYTVFINENYYYKEPGTTKSAKLADFVNVDNRQMYILCNTQKSPDQASSLTTSSIMIDQRSIKTIYDLSKVSSGWGVETVEENGPLYPSSFTNIQKETRTNGRYNFLNVTGLYDKVDADNVSWTNFVTPSNNSLVKEELDYACMSRNRDLDGDGNISADEIRWYLPATNQFTGLWLGRDALSPEVRLFQGIPADITKDGRYAYHYFSSNLVRFWAEEGAATASNGQGTSIKSKIRCVRNLGAHDTDKPGINDEPQDFVIPTYNNAGVLTKISLTRVNSGAIRSDFIKEGGIVGHAEHSGGNLNRPYKAFRVAVNDINVDKVNRTKLKNGINPCAGKEIEGETGWRAPNQRELTLIAGYLKQDLKHIIGSCTYSDLSKYKQQNIYVVAHGDINYVHLNDTDYNYVRCVKDVEP